MEESIYPWHLAPDWANWAGRNEYGDIIWLEHAPLDDDFVNVEDRPYKIKGIVADLLAALIGLLPENQPAHLNGEPSMAAVELARAAIAKATGHPYEHFDANETK